MIHLGLKTVPLCPILRFVTSSGSKKKETRYACLSEAKSSHRTQTEVSSSVPHFLQVGLLLNPILFNVSDTEFKFITCLYGLNLAIRSTEWSLLWNKFSCYGLQTGNLKHKWLKKIRYQTHCCQKLYYFDIYVTNTWVADGKCETFPYSSLTFKHLPHSGTTACISEWKKSILSVCNQKETPWFTVASVANCLPGRCFVRSPKGWNSLGRRWDYKHGGQ
jgi:hypothetical protein